MIMTTDKNRAIDLINFIDNSPSAYHAVIELRQQLEAAGYSELPLTEKWQIEKGGKYFTIKNGTAIFAFELGHGSLASEGINFICSHSDSPGFKVKPNPEMTVENNYLKLNTEVYGGPILNTWMDRPLSLAGRVMVEGSSPLQPKALYLTIDRPIMTIPNLAIHLNRSVNEGVALNKQKDMLPLVKMVNDKMESENFLINLIAAELNIAPESIVDFDLTLFDTSKGCLLGADEEFISVGKLDDLAMAHASVNALINSPATAKTKFVAVFDNEEVGSGTKQGAGSPVLRHILQRINMVVGGDTEDFQRMIYNSFMISADMAHAVHPNAAEIHDPTNRPYINKGPVIKSHANQKYTTDAESSAVFIALCKAADVPYQMFVNRSDLNGGSTLGNVSVGQIDIKCVDMGNPMFAMHSVRELGGVADQSYTEKVFDTFFSL